MAVGATLLGTLAIILLSLPGISRRNGAHAASSSSLETVPPGGSTTDDNDKNWTFVAGPAPSAAAVEGQPSLAPSIAGTFAPTTYQTYEGVPAKDMLDDDQLYEMVEAEINATAAPAANVKYKNLVFVLADQMRWDALGFVQNGLAMYRGKVKVRTPNLDRLAKQSVVFTTAYCQAPVCGSSRGSFYTGNTLRRTGIANNNFMEAKFYNTIPLHRDRIVRQRTFQQRLTDGYASSSLVASFRWLGTLGDNSSFVLIDEALV
jgi:hypothetical protein